MQQWEYHFEALQGDAIETISEVCAARGEDYWELVTMIVTNGAVIMVFKRPKRGLS